MSPKVTSQVNSLTAGELSPKALGRFDLEKYKSGAKKLENFLINQLGGVSFRPGTRYVASTTSDGVARLFPFQYSSNQDYVVEAGDEYFRLYSNDADLLTITQNTSPYPPSQSDTYVKSTTKFSTNFWAYYATDPTKSLTGTAIGNQWEASATTSQRFHIDLGTAEVVTKIYYENGHHLGGNTTDGAQNFTFWGSNTASAFAQLTYGTDTNWTQLTTVPTAFVEHTGSDVEDPKYITVTNTTAYRYYAFKFADNFGGGNFISVRRIELQATVLSTEISTPYVIADVPDLQNAQHNDVMYIVHPYY